MNKKWKKFSLGFSTLVSILAPIATTVACDQKTQNEKPSTKIDVSTAPTTPIVAPVATPSVIVNPDQKLLDAVANTTIGADGIYFWKDTYQEGSLWSGNNTGSAISDNGTKLIPMNTNDTPMGQNNAVEFGDGDKFYVIFDGDDKDGLSPEHFEDEFGFEDSSYMGGNDINNINTEFGNEFWQGSWGKNIIVKFHDGKSNGYFGSQSNHLSGTFDEALDKLKTQVSDDFYNYVIDYYNNSHSKAFFPVVTNEAMFTYRKVSNKIFEVTYHYNNDPVTAAAFVLQPTNDPNAFTNKSTAYVYYNWSLGTKTEWQAYENHPEATKFARKNVFINS